MEVFSDSPESLYTIALFALLGGGPSLGRFLCFEIGNAEKKNRQFY